MAKINGIDKVVKELKSFVQIGKKYEVSDHAVRKWMKTYELPNSAKELKELDNLVNKFLL